MLAKCRSYIKSVAEFIKFIIKFNGVVVVAYMPHAEKEKTGYYHRILAIDNILANIPVVYADWKPYQEKPNIVYEFMHLGRKDRVVYNINSLKNKALIFLCLIRCQKVYFHNIVSITSFFKLALRLPYIKSFLDFHGAAPEEHAMAGLHSKVKRMVSLELFALKYMDYFIVVTKAMQNHLEKKYSKKIDSKKVIILPIISSITQPLVKRQGSENKYTVIYAGNAESWQQLPRMVETICKTSNLYNYELYCTNPDAMNSLIPSNFKPSIRATLATHEELINIYKRCHFGFALREDNVVNQVACPTKLVEYLAYGIVPVLDSPRIGDFQELGMQYISLEILEQGNLPNKKQLSEISQVNYRVFEKLRQQYLEGCQKLEVAFAKL